MMKNLNALVLACISALAIASFGALASTANAQSSSGSYQVAQACGWYAISVCSRQPAGARRAANRHGGYVIDTSSEAYPNFRPGWYCAVVGPTTYRDAERLVQEMRFDGANSAYSKNGC